MLLLDMLGEMINYPMRFARKIPPLFSIAFYGSFPSKSHLIKSIEHKPLTVAIFLRPTFWSIWCH